MMNSKSHRRIQTQNRPFDFKELNQHPGLLTNRDQKGRRKTVIIVGGGIAGLTSAYELKKLGHEVVILEAFNRTGGRIKSHYFNDGTHAELGAMRIPAQHFCTLHYVKEFNLHSRRFVNHNPDAYYYLREKKVRIGSHRKLASNYNLSLDEYQSPFRWYENIMKELIMSLSTSEKWEMFSKTLSSPTLLKYNAISFWQYVKEHLSPEAFEFVGQATGMIQYEKASLLEVLIDYFGLFRVDQYELVGGMETLVKALTARLPGITQYNAKVTALEMTDTGVRVHWNRFGKKIIQESDYVICTVPLPALSKIDFQPALPARKLQAIRGVNYASSAKTIFHCQARPWEFNDGIYGGGSFTDLPIQQCWYPSDNAKPADNNTLTGFTGDDKLQNSEAPQHWIARNPDLSYSPGTFTASYLWENNARRFLALSQQERTDSVLLNIQKLHPQIEDHVDDIVHWSWDEQSSPGCGAFAYFAPGEHERYQKLLCDPYPLENPRVFFAGEHLSIAHAWIQGAIQTGLAATINVLQAPAPAKSNLERLAS